jgi:cytochrome P450
VCAELASACVSASGTRPLLDRCIRETLRLTAHTIGAIRRVVGRPFVLGYQTLPEPGPARGSPSRPACTGARDSGWRWI